MWMHRRERGHKGLDGGNRSPTKAKGAFPSHLHGLHQGLVELQPVHSRLHKDCSLQDAQYPKEGGGSRAELRSHSHFSPSPLEGLQSRAGAHNGVVQCVHSLCMPGSSWRLPASLRQNTSSCSAGTVAPCQPSLWAIPFGYDLAHNLLPRGEITV